MTAMESTIGKPTIARGDAADLGRMMGGVLYGEWLRTRYLLATSGALGVFAAYVLTAINQNKYVKGLDSDLIIGVALFLAEAFAFAVLLYSFDGKNRMVAGMPPMALRQPIPTWALVLVRYVYALTAIGLLTYALCLTWIAAGMYDGDALVQVGRWVFLFAVLQTVAYGAHRAGDSSIAILVATGMVVLVVNYWITASAVLFAALGPGVSMALAGAVSTIGYPLSLGAVARQRALSTSDRAESRSRSTRGTEPPPFSSALAAQQWYERKRHTGFIVRAAIASVAMAITIPVLIHGPRFVRDGLHHLLVYGLDDTAVSKWLHNAQTYVETLWAGSFIAVAAGVAIAGLVLALRWRRAIQGPERIFHYCRPLSMRDLIRARFVGVGSGVGVVALGLGVFAGLLGVQSVVNYSTLWPGYRPGLIENFEGLTIRAFILSVAAAPALLWIVFWTESSLVIFMLYGLASAVGYIAFGEEIPVLLVNGAAGATALVLVAATVHHVDQGRLSLWFAIAAFALALAGAIALQMVFSVEITDIPVFEERYIDHSVVLVLFCFIIAPLAAVPALIARARHR